jgi:hypothetical protein
MNRDDSDDGVIDLNRRAVLESAVTLALASAVSPSSQLSAASAPTIPAHHTPTVGIQMDVNTLSKPNLSPLLDDLQTHAGSMRCFHLFTLIAEPGLGFRNPVSVAAILRFRVLAGAGVALKELGYS